MVICYSKLSIQPGMFAFAIDATWFSDSERQSEEVEAGWAFAHSFQKKNDAHSRGARAALVILEIVTLPLKIR